MASSDSRTSFTRSPARGSEVLIPRLQQFLLMVVTRSPSGLGSGEPPNECDATPIPLHLSTKP